MQYADCVGNGIERFMDFQATRFFLAQCNQNLPSWTRSMERSTLCVCVWVCVCYLNSSELFPRHIVADIVEVFWVGGARERFLRARLLAEIKSDRLQIFVGWRFWMSEPILAGLLGWHLHAGLRHKPGQSGGQTGAGAARPPEEPLTRVSINRRRSLPAARSFQSHRQHRRLPQMDPRPDHPRPQQQWYHHIFIIFCARRSSSPAVH